MFDDRHYLILARKLAAQQEKTDRLRIVAQGWRQAQEAIARLWWAEQVRRQAETARQA